MNILSEILSALETEERVMMATIISTSGSTPASALSKMIVKDNCSTWVGTVGGGCMEADVLEKATELFRENKAAILRFELKEDDIPHGLICGGTLDVLIEPITRKLVPFFQGLNSLSDEGEDSIVATLLTGEGLIRFKRLIPLIGARDDDSLLEHWGEAILQSTPGLPEELRKTYTRHETRRLQTPEGELILEPAAGSPNLILFGGGHVSKYVSRAAAMVGFRVSIVDDRKEYSSATRFPEAAETLVAEFNEVFDVLKVKPSSYIVIVTRGHRFDEEILEKAIRTPARYIGMIGSKRKVLATYRHLADRGIAVDDLSRIFAPMGLDIGAVTAEEIAVSIVSELIKVRRHSTSPPGHKSAAMQHLLDKIRSAPKEE